MIHASRPIFSTQFHPEAKGGPLDSSYLFDMYMDNVHKYKEGQSTSQPYRDSKPSPLLVDLLAKERVGVDLTQGIRNMMASTTQEPERVYAAGAA
jgi:carbamoyl-phosphate synthase small subunit